MNAKLWICAAGAAISALACTREVVEQDIETTTNEIELTASWVQDDESGSRTALQKNGTSIWWTKGEEINAFFGTMASGKFTSTNKKPQATVTFTGTLTSLIGDIETDEGNAVCWAVYPYNEANTCDGQSVTMTISRKQEAVAGSFADKFFPAVAKSNSFSLAFYNVCGGVRFSLTQEGVRRVIFKSNDGSPMAGKVRVGFGEDNRPQIIEITDPVDSVIIIAPKGGTFTSGTHYFAALLPQIHTEGIKIISQTIENTEACKVLANSLTVHRSSFGLLDNMDDNIEYNNIESVMVELGLSVKWATRNIGADSTEEYGEYYAWGETEPKIEYSWENYKFCTAWASYSNLQFSKYSQEDNKTRLDPEDDIAIIELDEGWRMPTRTECEDLLTSCTHSWTTINGCYGALLTSNVFGYADKWIFLPAAGMKSKTKYDSGVRCYYWSSSRNTDHPHIACSMDLISNDKYVSDNRNRCNGYPIRPVYDD